MFGWVSARVQKTVNSRISVVNLDTHDREGLPGDEGHEGGSRRNQARAKILDGEMKRPTAP